MRKSRKDMLNLALHIVDTKRADFDPGTFEDEYEQALREIIEKKAKGKKIKRAKAPARTNVVSLMDALRASVDAEGRPEPRKSKRAAASRPARKTSRSHSKHKRLAGDRAHVFEFVLFAHYRLCRCDLVLARRPIRARWSHGPSTEVSDLVRHWRGDPTQIAALRSCPPKRGETGPTPSLNPIKLSIRPSLRPTILSSNGLGEGTPWTTTQSL